MHSKTPVFQQLFAFLFILAWLLFAFSTLSAQQTDSPRLWTVKLNLLSPVWKNIGGELEVKTGPRFALVAGAGVERAFESLPAPEPEFCVRAVGFGAAMGGKYFLVLRESGKRSIDGLALKSTLNYTFTDEVAQTCPTFIPIALYRGHGFALNSSLAAQKTFFDRLVVEAQAGVGGSVTHRVVKESELLAAFKNETRFRVFAPVALHVGLVF